MGRRDDLVFSGFSGRRTVLDDHARVDLSVRHPIPGPRTPGGTALTPTLRVDHVLDADYEEVSGCETPGRTWLVGVRTSLGP